MVLPHGFLSGISSLTNAEAQLEKSTQLHHAGVDLLRYESDGRRGHAGQFENCLGTP